MASAVGVSHEVSAVARRLLDALAEAGSDLDLEGVLARIGDEFSGDAEILAVALTAAAGAAIANAVVEDEQRIAGLLNGSVIQPLFRAGLTLQALRQGIVDQQMRQRIDAAIDDLDRGIVALRACVFDTATESALTGP